MFTKILYIHISSSYIIVFFCNILLLEIKINYINQPKQTKAGALNIYHDMDQCEDQVHKSA